MVLDSFDDLERLERVAGERGARQAVLIRVTPGVAGRTHAAISTGQADSKFGFGMDDARRAIERLRGSERLDLQGLHMHIGSQLLSLDAYRPAVEAIATLGDFPVYNLGGGLGVAYTAEQHPPSIEQYVEVQVDAANELLGRGKKLLIEPGRSLVANACVTLYTVQTVKRNVSTWVASTAACRTTCARCSTAPSTRRSWRIARTEPAPASAVTSPASTASRAT